MLVNIFPAKEVCPLEISPIGSRVQSQQAASQVLQGSVDCSVDIYVAENVTLKNWQTLVVPLRPSIRTSCERNMVVLMPSSFCSP